MRKIMIAANWKMNTTVSEAKELARALIANTEMKQHVEVLICPPFISTETVYNEIKGSGLLLGAQNMHYEDKGAFTGEVSPIMIAGMCQYVILGHSERRSLFGESSQIVNLKIKAAIRHKIKPILCVGESLDENKNSLTESVLHSQLSQSLEGISNADMTCLVIAYEPVWAIGTGLAASARQADDTIGFLRKALAEIFDKDVSDKTRILYGGSANATNISEYLRERQIDGALVGGAALKANEFTSMILKASQTQK